MPTHHVTLVNERGLGYSSVVVFTWHEQGPGFHPEHCKNNNNIIIIVINEYICIYNIYIFMSCDLLPVKIQCFFDMDP
jgi:hypothetical protein